MIACVAFSISLGIAGKHQKHESDEKHKIENSIGEHSAPHHIAVRTHHICEREKQEKKEKSSDSEYPSCFHRKKIMG